MAENDFSYVKFSRQSWYRDINARLVDKSGVVPGSKVVDLGCGAGLVTRLLLERLKGARNGMVIAVDYSSTALSQARDELGNAWANAVEFVQGRAEQVSELVKERVDAVFFCNAIHLVADKDTLMNQVSSTLPTGGIFVFNTSFFKGEHPEETEIFYRRWMTKAIRLLRSQYNLSLQKEDKVEARKQLTPEEYQELLGKHGFTVRQQDIETIPVPMEGWVGISQFADFVEGALPGVPVEKASVVLKKAVVQTFEELKLTVVPRRWLSVVAVKQ